MEPAALAAQHESWAACSVSIWLEFRGTSWSAGITVCGAFSATPTGRCLRALEEVLRRHDCALHAWVLMTNHVDLLVTPASAGAVSRIKHTKPIRRD